MAKKLDLPDLLHLISELPVSDIEKLTVRAIRTYRRLIENAEKQFQELPDDYKCGTIQGGAQHLSYIETEIQMFTQSAAVSTLIDVLGYVPDVPDDEGDRAEQKSDDVDCPCFIPE